MKLFLTFVRTNKRDVAATNWHRVWSWMFCVDNKYYCVDCCYRRPLQNLIPVSTVVKSPANINPAKSRQLGVFQLDGDHRCVELALLVPTVQESPDLDDVKIVMYPSLEMNRSEKSWPE